MTTQEELQLLIEAVLQELASDAEALLLITSALEDRASDVSSHATPQRLREVAALVKAAAIQTGLAAANVVGSAERLRLVAEFGNVETADWGPPS